MAALLEHGDSGARKVDDENRNNRDSAVVMLDTSRYGASFRDVSCDSWIESLPARRTIREVTRNITK
jgi:hypothetical protein